MPHPVYAKFPVIETIDLSSPSTVQQAADRLVQGYLTQQPEGKFSYRLLLPRDSKTTQKAKTIGLAFQGEFLLGLRKRKIVPNIREVRYVHDDDHYGWLLANPEVYEQFENGIV
ncbi:MAG TPA: hypothetical protein VJ695_10070 [Nitrososphaera sp.]|nr:hypothetical protein [Nitrososphaera sp.]